MPAKDKRPWFRVDVGYMDNPKISELVEDHPRAIVLHLFCIGYAKQHGTNGRVPMRLAMRRACSEQCDLDACIRLGILHLDESGPAPVLVVHDYLDHQESAETEQIRSDKARRAAEARWGDAPSNAPSMPNALPDAVPDAMQNREEKNREREPRKRATRLPRDWKPSTDLMLELRQQRADLDLDQVLQDFSDYWHAKAGKDAVKVDWSLTFRSWVRKEHVGLHNAARSDASDPLAGWSAPPPDDDTIAAGTRAIAEHYRRAREAELARRQQGAA